MANARALDIAERQIAIDYYEDEQFSWHHRILLISAGNGRWILATPDHEVQYQDLSDKRVVPLPRGARFPVRVRGDIYAFDPITREELNALYVEARALAEVVGVQVPTTTTGPGAPRWVISDPAHELFGSVLDNDICGNDNRLVSWSARSGSPKCRAKARGRTRIGSRSRMSRRQAARSGSARMRRGVGRGGALGCARPASWAGVHMP
jgi:hypothetical protein